MFAESAPGCSQFSAPLLRRPSSSAHRCSCYRVGQGEPASTKTRWQQWLTKELEDRASGLPGFLFGPPGCGHRGVLRTEGPRKARRWGSRLFLCKATGNLLRWTGDTGAYLRTTMGALVLFGVPPEEYWPYVIANFDEGRSAFCYWLARNYQTLQYFRLDPLGTDRKVLLARIKLFLAAGLPLMFGFTVFSSISQASDDGKIPCPGRREQTMGGLVRVAVLQVRPGGRGGRLVDVAQERVG